MTDTMEPVAFFEREEGSLDSFPVENYVAGLRQPDGTIIGGEIKLPALLVEKAVLTGARLSVWLALDGRLVLDGEGVGDDALEAAGAAGGLAQHSMGMSWLRAKASTQL